MAILALYNNIEVEITGTLHTGDGRIKATVRALAGQPFTQLTHGGPVDTNAAIVSPDLLTDVHQAEEEQPAPAHKIRRSRMPGAGRPELTYGPMDESLAPLFPVRSRRQPWKGINSD